MLDVTSENLEQALWNPKDYNWGPSQTEEVTTQGGGTAIWNPLIGDYVFKEPPSWWKECKPGDTVPREWGII